MGFESNSKGFKDMLLRVENVKSNGGGVLPELALRSRVQKVPHIRNSSLTIERSRSNWTVMQEQMQIIHYILTESFDRRPWCGDGAREGSNGFGISRQEDPLEAMKIGCDRTF